MAHSIGDRLETLERRLRPAEPHEPSPAMDLLLTLMEHSRAESAALAAGLEPPPLVLTPEQEAESRKGEAEFLSYLEEQRELARGNPAGLETIEQAIRMTREEIDLETQGDAKR